jgi:SAM-dependent methyltransferase
MMQDRVRRAMSPTDDEIAAMPLSVNARIARELLGEACGSVLDIGCGEGKFTRALTAFVGQVAGVDVKANKIAMAQEACKREGVSVDFRVASGEDLPYADGAFDAVVFSNSLHHMPAPAKALREALRVLKPGGLLYVMEPVPAGNYFEATKFVNDETIVRTEAYVDLCKIEGAEPVREILYRAERLFDAFEEWRCDQIDRDPRREAKFDAGADEVRKTFESSAVRRDGKLVFNQVFRVNLLRKH